MSSFVAKAIWMYFCFSTLLIGQNRKSAEAFPFPVLFPFRSTARYELIAVEAVRTESTITRPLSTTPASKPSSTTEKALSTARIPDATQSDRTDISSTVSPTVTRGSDNRVSTGEISTNTSSATGEASTGVSISDATTPEASFITKDGTAMEALSTTTTMATDARPTEALSTITSISKDASITGPLPSVTNGLTTIGEVPTSTSAISDDIFTSNFTMELETNDMTITKAPSTVSFITTVTTAIGELFSSTSVDDNATTNEAESTNLTDARDATSMDESSTSVFEIRDASTFVTSDADTPFTSIVIMNDTTTNETSTTSQSLTDFTNSTEVLSTDTPVTNETAIAETSTIPSETETPVTRTPITITDAMEIDVNETFATATDANSTEGMVTEAFFTVTSPEIAENLTEGIITTNMGINEIEQQEITTVSNLRTTTANENPKVTELNMSMYLALKDLENEINSGKNLSLESLIKVLVLTYRIQKLGGEVNTENKDQLKKIAPFYEKSLNEIVTT